MDCVHIPDLALISCAPYKAYSDQVKLGVTADVINEAASLLKNTHFVAVILDLAGPGDEGVLLLPLLNKSASPSVPIINFPAKDVSRKTAENIIAVPVKPQTPNDDVLNTARSSIDTGAC